MTVWFFVRYQLMSWTLDAGATEVTN